MMQVNSERTPNFCACKTVVHSSKTQAFCLSLCRSSPRHCQKDESKHHIKVEREMVQISVGRAFDIGTKPHPVLMAVP